MTPTPNQPVGVLLKNQETFYNNNESIAKKPAIDSQSTNIQSIAYTILFLRAKYVGYLTEISIAFIVYVFRSLMRKRSLIEEFYAHRREKRKTGKKYLKKKKKMKNSMI